MLEQKQLKKQILSLISASNEKITPANLGKKLIKENPDISRKDIRLAISELVAGKELDYIYCYGCSFIERSFNRPVRVSRHVVLRPDGLKKADDSGIDIVLMHGASFGTGAHPTTRLAINGLEYIWKGLNIEKEGEKLKALDIGTGSGVLAIAAAKFGFQRVDAVDIDACARFEAINNVKLNGLTERIAVSDRDVHLISSNYDLVMANLRFPTIMAISCLLAQRVLPKGWVVISGIKDREKSAVVNEYEKYGFHCSYQADEVGWSGLVLEKNELKTA